MNPMGLVLPTLLSPPLQSNSHTVKLLVFMDTITFIVSLVLPSTFADIVDSFISIVFGRPVVLPFSNRWQCLLYLCACQTIGRMLSSLGTYFVLFSWWIFTHLNFQVVAHNDINQSSIVQAIYILFCSLMQSPFHITIQFAGALTHSANVCHSDRSHFTVFSICLSRSLANVTALALALLSFKSKFFFGHLLFTHKI